jgi:hypothetical protein
MRSAVAGVLVALVLFVAGAACWSEARLARSVANAYQRLATLNLDEADGIDAGMTALSLLPWPTWSLSEDVRRHRATVAYWRSEYRQLANASPSSGANTGGSPVDPAVMFVAANAAFRASLSDPSDRAATVDRLDRVIQAYADVLRAQPGNADASYNYEYVVKFRDTFTKNRQTRITKEQRRVDGELDMSVDLPVGPTVHGRPGGPPQNLLMQQFKTVTPMKFEEREELEPGRGIKQKRRG